MVVIDEAVEDVKGSDVDQRMKQRALKQASHAKEEGNNLFRAGQYEDALLQYELALQIASEVPSSAKLCSICHGNRAVCFLKLGKLNDTITECTKALELNPSYTKALLKRGEAHENLENYDDAISDMKKVIEIDPKNDQAIRNMRRIQPIAIEKQEKSKEEIIGSDVDQESSFEDALTQEQLNERALKQANNAKEEGNKLFRACQYEDALLQYELALQIASEVPSSAELCSVCHGNRAVCFLKLSKNKDAITECTKALELNPSYTKALLKRGEAYEKLENYDDAFSDMKKVIKIDPENDQAIRNIRRLDPIATEKQEKSREEAIGKVKEMVNPLLGLFGLSTDNFKAVKDPNTGSYSISFQQ